MVRGRYKTTVKILVIFLIGSFVAYLVMPDSDFDSLLLFFGWFIVAPLYFSWYSVTPDESSDVEIINTSYFHDSRPYVVIAQGQTKEKRHVEGVGVSYLTRNHASNKAIIRAQRVGQEYELSYRILDVKYRRLTMSYLRQQGKIEVQKTGMPIPLFKIRVTADFDGKSADGTNTSYLRANGTKGLKKAIGEAQSQLQKMSFQD